jgi:hypothetical protein
MLAMGRATEMPLLANRSARNRRKYTYNVRLIRLSLSYTIHEIAETFDLHPNAVRRWVKAGLRTIDDRRPQLIYGSDLIGFLRKRQQGRKHRCGPGEMYCCKCRAPRRPRSGCVVVDHLNARQLMIRGECELCGTRMNRGGSLARLAEVELAFATTAAAPRLGKTSDPPVICDLPQGA